ncbi:FAD/NAD(P)-binding protein [Candidatus Woesearchaeota archaeon]|nr:FAD/NAD(P)-binding protein [Candidatus Woesearchaeota archaeon]
MENPYKLDMVKVLEVRTLTQDTKLFKLDYKIKHQPGQFLQVGMLGKGECPISICSNSSKYVELCIRNVGNVTNFLTRMKKGDKIGVRGPYGKGFPVDEFEGKDIIIVGGGTGVAPVRGVIKYVEDHRNKFPRVDIFLGFRTPNDMLFKNEIMQWKKFSNLYFTVDKAAKNWKGNVGFIMPLLEKAKINKTNSIAIAVGPPIMIKFIIEKLKNMGFSDGQIYVSLERMMQCGIGKCGHCAVGGKLVCKCGPVFSYKDAKELVD